MSAMLRPYGVQTTIIFPIPKAGDTDFAATGDWTPATGDTKVSKDGGDVANTTNNPAAVGGSGSVLWSLTLTAAEMQAARAVVQIVDAAVENQALVIETYGHASAQHPAFPATDSAGAALATATAVRAGLTTVTGTVDNTVAPTTTVFEADDITEATADHYNGRTIIFATGDLAGQACIITDYALVSGRGRFTVSRDPNSSVPLTEAPANDVTFYIV